MSWRRWRSAAECATFAVVRFVRPRQWLLPLSAAIAPLCLLAGTALAADGALDPSFDGDGRAVAALTAFGDSASDVAIDPAGRLVVVGVALDPKGPAPQRAEIARFLPNGELDRSFSGDGFDLIPWSSGSSSANSVAIDSAGRIVVGGDVFSSVTGFDFAAARYLPEGIVDASFGGGDGVVSLDLPGAGVDIGRAVAVDAQDRVLLAGQAVAPGAPSVSRMGLVRFTAAGLPDPSFDGDGTLLVSFPGRSDALAAGLAIDGAGRIVVGGSAATVTGSEGEFAVARLLDNGGFDLGFGSGGEATLDFGDLPQEEMDDLVLDGSGRIVVVGQSGSASSYVADVGRLLPGGTPDPSFGGGDGRTTTAVQGYLSAAAVAVDRAERIVVAGLAGNPLAQDAALLRYTAAGEPDQSFGTGGLVREDFLASNASGRGVAIDAAGRYVLAGTAVASAGANSIGLARFSTAYPDAGVPGSPPGSPPLPPEKPTRCNGVVATIVGGGSKDRIKGTAKRDVIAALGGDDVIRSLGGNDLVCAGAGKDLVVGGRGADYLLGDGGADRLLGGPGRDKLLGQAGADRLLGGPGKDVLSGGPGRDAQR